ncbi:sigma-70 family RNA polymerase sigma factor [Nonomuraea sp. SMC257]|uniref:Sigma-70 family RNA polymerase sigma factor n=1 Tax=Nonomuraea montanisoli TaxID=2741721 RepID=A0A7Y6I738_9ACTN|nr:sigma-70 family RNA polymerase sigma factor [Nonomuraea montanisoli]NUW31975.1 sigma-70 family RNA polymerase sigma factor [Nonomuraea montanisoli]
MNDHDFLAGRFEEHRTHLKAVAYRMLGSLSEADDAVQEAWLRLSRSGADGVDNLGGWLTTVVGRVCLDMLRSRRARREDGMGAHLPDPVVSAAAGGDPEHEALVADSVGLALLVVLQSLAPAERLAFVLHDMFGVPFEEIGPLVERTPAAARQLASRARRRVRGGAPRPEPDLARQRRVVEAFQAAARDGDFEALVAVLHPDVVARADTGAPGGVVEVRGAANVAKGALSYRRVGQDGRHVLVNGSAGYVNVVGGRAVSVHSFTIVDGLVTAIDILADPERLEALDLTAPAG